MTHISRQNKDKLEIGMFCEYLISNMICPSLLCQYVVHIGVKMKTLWVHHNDNVTNICMQRFKVRAMVPTWG